jgi:hypothetical protein
MMREVMAMRIAILAALCAIAAAPALAGPIDDAPSLSDAQLGKVSGGQEIVQTDQGTTALAAERGTLTPQGFTVGGPGNAAAFAAQSPAGVANAASTFGTSPILGQLVGSSSGVRYGN